MRRNYSHTRLVLALTAGSALAAGAVIWAQPQRTQPAPSAHGAADGHVLLTEEELEWAEGPSSLPPGLDMAVLEGDPMVAGPFTFRARMPAGYEIPAHHHPQIEHVTVISGTLSMGTGDKLDRSKGMKLGPGGFAVMPIGLHHFAWADEETVIQVHGVGPWGIIYVDPATDPRNKQQ